jgi:putative nucleotidyltransferase with HDIG domain
MPTIPTPEEFIVTMDQLRIGLHVQLDLKWFEHPFAFNNFRIKTEDQIRTLRSLGLKTVRYDPSRSEPEAEAVAQATSSRPRPEAADVSAITANAELARALEAKHAIVERNKRQREATVRVENAFVDTANTLRGIEKNLLARPEETVRQATHLVAQIVDSILSAPELAIHIMGEKLGGEDLYFHSLNVIMLSMIMARDISLPEVVSSLGMGALFHDIGRNEIPGKILLKKDPLTPAERSFYELHCQYGVEIGQRLNFHAAILAIIREHHEAFDGSGYPAKLKGEAINLLSRIVAIANYYDELCNPQNIAEALTPHEALSLMFMRWRNKFDPKLLQVFIRCLGVYPPGTIVQLSNGVIGVVATINTAQPMKPIVVIYDQEIPKEEAILVQGLRTRTS